MPRVVCHKEREITIPRYYIRITATRRRDIAVFGMAINRFDRSSYSKMSEFKLEAIPEAPGYPIVGNLFDLDKNNVIGSIRDLMKDRGPILRVRVVDKQFIFVGSQELVDELCDQSRFEKVVTGPLEQLRKLGGDGMLSQPVAPMNSDRTFRSLHRSHQ